MGYGRPQLGAQTVTPAEIAVLDGATEGTAVASKALVANSSTTLGALLGLGVGAAIPTNPQAVLAVVPPANASGVTANQSYFHQQVLPGGAVTIPTGTAPVVASMNVHEPNITATGTVTDAVTFRVVDAPTEGGTGNYAFWVDAGTSRFDSTVVFGATVAPTNPQAQVAILPQANASGVTANQSYFHVQALPSGAVTVPTGTAPVVATMNLHEPNITATGTVTAAATLRIVDAPTEGSTNYALWVDSGSARFDGNLDIAAGAVDLVAKANTAAAFRTTDATTALYVLDTRNTVTVQNHLFDLPASQTLPNGATSRLQGIVMPAHTVTLVGTTQVTTANDGAMLTIMPVTYAQSGGAVTVDAVSAVFIGTPVAGSSVTITKNSFIQTGVAGCFCSAAGTWTDTSSREVKKDIKDIDMEEVGLLIDRVDVVKFRKKEIWDGDHERYGVIAEDVPDCLASPDRNGVASIYLAGFTLAGVKYLREENRAIKAENETLKSRLNAIEAKLGL